MAYSPSDQPQASGSPDLRRSVGEATERIHEIIDAAERVASEIRSDAEADARRYLEERQREADEAVAERNEAIDRLTRTLADTAEQFKHQAERMLAELDRAIVDARAGVYRQGALAALEDRPAGATAPPEPDRSPGPLKTEPEPRPFEPLSPLASTDEPFELPPLEPSADDPLELPPLEHQPVEREPAERERRAPVSAYPGRVPEPWREAGASAAGGDATSEALLRATQMAVTGKERGEIAEVLRTDFPGVETDALLDEILG